jgi:hypothetical protein
VPADDVDAITEANADPDERGDQEVCALPGTRYLAIGIHPR